MNDDFSIEHAEANFGGEESENNRKFEWQDEMKITTSVTGINMHKKANYPLKGVMPDETPFDISIPNMRLFEIEGEAPVYVGCSESILDSFEIEEGENWILRLFLKDFEPMANPIPGIYIAAQEFPKELIVH